MRLDLGTSVPTRRRSRRHLPFDVNCRVRIISGFCAALAACLGAAAHAQEAPAASNLFDHAENVSVRDRPRPEFEAVGVRAGAFLVFPKLTLTVGDNDNVLATRARPLASAVFQLEPQMVVQSDWGRNTFTLTADSTLSRFAAYPQQNSDQYALKAEGRLDVAHDLAIGMEASQARMLIPPTEAAISSTTALLYDETLAKVDLTEAFDRLKLSTTGSFERLSYSDGRGADGRAIDQGFRNENEFIGVFRADYALSASLALFAEETLAHNQFNRSRFADQDVTETLVGPSFEIGHLASGEIGVGYLTSAFGGGQVKSTGTLHARAALTYYATPLITLAFKGEQGVYDSGIPGSPDFISRTLALEADYEFRRNVIVTASVASTVNDFRLIDRHDRYLHSKLSATYLANRGLGMVLAFERTSRSSTGSAAGRTFEDDVVSLALTLQR